MEAINTSAEFAYSEGYEDGISNIIEKPFTVDNIYSYGQQVDIDNTWRHYSHAFNITMHPNSMAITVMTDSRASHQYSIVTNNENIQVDHVLNNGGVLYLGVLRNISDEEQTVTVNMYHSLYGGTGAGRDNIAYYIFRCE